MNRLNPTSFQPATPAAQPAQSDAAPTPAQNTPGPADATNNTTTTNTPASTPISSALDSFLFEVAELTQIASSCGMRIADFHALTRTPEVAEQLTARRALARERLDSIITDAKAVAFRALTVLCADGMVHAQDNHLPHKTRLYYAEITRRAASLILRFAHAHDTAHLNGPGPTSDQAPDLHLAAHPDDAPINFNDLDPSSPPSATRASTPGHSLSPPTPPAPFTAPPIAEVRPLTPHVPTVRLPKPKEKHKPNTPQSPPPSSGAGAAAADPARVAAPAPALTTSPAPPHRGASPPRAPDSPTPKARPPTPPRQQQPNARARPG